MTDASDQGGEAPCWAHFIDDLEPSAAPFTVGSANTIVYCNNPADVVAFYRDAIGLQTTMDRGWFVEFELRDGAHLSVANADRATVTAGDGSGLTLSWRVDDLDGIVDRLRSSDVETSPVVVRWGARCCYVFDPAGNRVEFWAMATDPDSSDHDHGS